MRYFKTSTGMVQVEIGDKILFNHKGLDDELELYEVVDGHYVNTKNKEIGIDLLNTQQEDDGQPNGMTLLQCGIEAGYIRLFNSTEGTKEKVKTAHENLADHLWGLYKVASIGDLKHRKLLAGEEITQDEAREILMALEAIEKTLKYAKNCCHWIINGWEKNKA